MIFLASSNVTLGSSISLCSSKGTHTAECAPCSASTCEPRYGDKTPEPKERPGGGGAVECCHESIDGLALSPSAPASATTSASESGRSRGGMHLENSRKRSQEQLDHQRLGWGRTKIADTMCARIRWRSLDDLLLGGELTWTTSAHPCTR